MNKCVCSDVTTFTQVLHVYIYNIDCPQMAKITCVMEILYLKQRCELKSYTGMFSVVV